MDLKTYRIEHFESFSSKIKTEEDVKMHVIRPFLETLGYSIKNMRFENSMPVQTGTKKVTVHSDIEIFENGNVELISKYDLNDLASVISFIESFYMCC